MRIGEILAAFENEVVLPIDLGRIMDWIKSKGLQDEIEFIGVDLDHGVIRGFLHRFTYHTGMYSEPVMAAHIYYGKDQPPEWVNIVCCKEMLHLVDKKWVQCSTPEQIEELVSRLVLPREMQLLADDPSHVKMDMLGDIIAAGLLLPMAARELLMEPYMKKQVTAQDISELAMLPVQYVRSVMSDQWPSLYELFKNM